MNGAPARERSNVVEGTLAPRLAVGFRGPLLAAAIEGDRAVCLAQDFYDAHWQDLWIFELSLSDGALLAAILVQESHDHGPRHAPFSTAGDVVLAPVSRVLEAWRLSSGERVPVREAAYRERSSVDWRSGYRPMRAGLVIDGGARALVQERPEVLGVWDLVSGQRSGELRERMGPIQAAAIAPDGAHLAIATSSRLRLWDLARGAADRTIGTVSGRTTSLAFRPDGRALVSCEERGLVTTWDIERRGRPVRRAMLACNAVYEGTGDRCAAVALEPDPAPDRGGELLTRTIHVWDAFTHEPLLRQPLPDWHSRSYGFAGAPRVVGFLPGGEIVLHDYHALVVLEHGAGAWMDPPGSWEVDSTRDEEGAGTRLPFGSYGPPVAIRRRGEDGFRRVTTAAFRAALRPAER